MRRDLIILHLLEAVSWFDQISREKLKQLGRPIVSRTQATLLAHIASGECRPTRLAERVGISKQAVSVALSDLEQRDMLIFEPDPEDGRAKVVKFAPGIEQYREDTIAIFEDIEQTLTEVWGEHEMKIVRKALAIDWQSLPRQGNQ